MNNKKLIFVIVAIALTIVFSVFFKSKFSKNNTQSAEIAEAARLLNLSDRKDPNGQSAALSIIANLDKSPKRVTSAAIRALGAYSDESSFKQLKQMTKSPDPIFKLNALQALGRFEDEKRADLLLDLIKSNTLNNREILYAQASIYLSSLRKDRQMPAFNYVKSIALNKNDGLQRIAEGLLIEIQAPKRKELIRPNPNHSFK